MIYAIPVISFLLGALIGGPALDSMFDQMIDNFFSYEPDIE